MQKVMTVADIATELCQFCREKSIILRSRKILSWLNNNFRNLHRTKNLFNTILPGLALIWIFSYENSIHDILVTLCDFFFKKNRPSMTQRTFYPSLIFYKKESTTSGVTSRQKLCIEIIYIVLETSVSSQKKNNTKCRKQNSKTTWKYCRSYCWNEIDDEILPVFAQFLQSLKLIYFLEFTSLNVQDWTQVLSSYMAGLFDIFILRQIWQNCVCFGDFLPMRKLWCLS